MNIDYSNVGYYSRVWGDAIDNGYENIISFIKIAIALYLMELLEKHDIKLKR